MDVIRKAYTTFTSDRTANSTTRKLRYFDLGKPFAVSLVEINYKIIVLIVSPIVNCF